MLNILNNMSKPLLCKVCGKERKLGSLKCKKCEVKEYQERLNQKKLKDLQRKEVKKEKKNNSISKLKKACWKLCSEYNRRKDCNLDGYVECCTCPKVAHWKKLQAGHFIPGRCNSILFDDRGIHAQCYGCNIVQHGNWVSYETFMIERYGKKVVEEIKQNKYNIKKFTPQELQEMIKDYKYKISLLPKN